MRNSKNQSHLPRYALDEGCSVPFQRPKILFQVPQPQKKHLDLVLKHFWNRCRRDYLTELREHHLGKKTSQSRVIRKVDVVCVHEDNVPRQRWKLATVQELIHGRDNIVRAAVVWLASKGGRVEIQRPVQKLYPVEVYGRHDGGNKENVVTAPSIIRFVSDEAVETVRCG